MKTFDIPSNFTSSFISKVRQIRNQADPKKTDFKPSTLVFESARIYLPRHFGFCYGVQNAVEKSYTILKENPNRTIYLLSEMIHNKIVNDDLRDQGLRFILDTAGQQLISWDLITQKDIVIIPAFGASLEIIDILKSKNIQIEKYDTTCPFVERVWNRGKELAQKEFTLIIHGTFNHEETRATFSRMSSKGQKFGYSKQRRSLKSSRYDRPARI